MSAIERHDQIGVQPLGEGYHRRIDPTEGEVGVAVDELSDPCPIIALRATNIDADERFEEASLYARSKPGSDKIAGLGQHECRDHDPKPTTLQNVDTPVMILVIPIDRRVERPGINDADA